jgi:hypothetical protein
MPGLTIKMMSTVLLLLLIATFRTGCDNNKILQEQARAMLISEAQQGFHDFFKKGFDPAKTQVLVGRSLKQLLDKNKAATSRLPPEVQKDLASASIGLLINGALTGRKGGAIGVIYMRPGRVGGPRRFLTLDPDPCGDGNPATCELCLSCSGETSPGSTISTCVCSQSCDDCRPCPTC